MKTTKMICHYPRRLAERVSTYREEAFSHFLRWLLNYKIPHAPEGACAFDWSVCLSDIPSIHSVVSPCAEMVLGVTMGDDQLWRVDMWVHSVAEQAVKEWRKMPIRAQKEFETC